MQIEVIATENLGVHKKLLNNIFQCEELALGKQYACRDEMSRLGLEVGGDDVNNYQVDRCFWKNAWKDLGLSILLGMPANASVVTVVT